MNKLRKFDEMEMSFQGAGVLLPLIGLGRVAIEILLFTLTTVFDIRAGETEPFRLALLIALWGAIVFVALNTKRIPSSNTMAENTAENDTLQATDEAIE